MKNRILSVFFCFLVISGLPQQLTFKMDHPRLIRSANKQLLRFDVLMKASQDGTYLYATQVALNCNAVNFVTTPSNNIQVTKGFISGDYNGNQKYDINAAHWNGNQLGIQITASTANSGASPSDACSQVLTEYQVLITIGIEVSNPEGIAGLDFRGESMVAGPGGLQQFALDPLPTHGYYVSPNLFEGENFLDLYLGRIFSSGYGWSQFGGQVNDIPYLDWGIPVNTSDWDSTADIDDTALAGKLRIHSSAELVLNTGARMNCYDSVEIGRAEGLQIRSAPEGTGSFIDNGVITYINNGSAAVERYFSQQRWHGYCIPVQSTVTQPFLDHQLLMKWYDEPQHRYRKVLDPTGDSLLDIPMLGYFVYAGPSSPPGPVVVTEGMLNTGPVTIPVTATEGPGGPDGWNLIGNPYPSGVLWPSMVLDDVDPVMYIFDPIRGNYIFWNSLDATHTTGISPVIPAMQGFYVHCNEIAPGSGTVSVNNGARVHENTIYYRPGLPVDQLLVLTASANGFTDEAQIWFNDAATPSFDTDHDAYKLWGDERAPQLYSELPDSNIAMLNVIPWAPETMVPMGYRTGFGGTDTLIASNLTSFPDTIPVWIHDLQEQRWQELTSDPVYIFSADPGDEPDRFRILFADPALLIGNPGADAPAIWSYGDCFFVMLTAVLKEPAGVVLLDLAGRTVFNADLRPALMNRFCPGVVEGLYIVRVISGSKVYNRKIFLR